MNILYKDYLKKIGKIIMIIICITLTIMVAYLMRERNVDIRETAFSTENDIMTFTSSLHSTR